MLLFSRTSLKSAAVITSWSGFDAEHKYTETPNGIKKMLRVTTGLKHRGHSVKKEGALPAKTRGTKKNREDSKVPTGLDPVL